MWDQKGLAPILIIFLIALAIGGYFVYQKQNTKTSTIEQVSQPTSKDETINWKTYTSETFSFKYPENLIYEYILYNTSDNIDKTIPTFFRSKEDLKDAMSSSKKPLHTPYGRRLFDISEVTNYEIGKGKQDIQSYLKDSPSLTERYKDTHGRDWTILAASGLDGTQTNAEVKINNKTYQVQIHLYDEFLAQEGKEDPKFIHNILSTFKFTN